MTCIHRPFGLVTFDHGAHFSALFLYFCCYVFVACQFFFFHFLILDHSFCFCCLCYFLLFFWVNFNGRASLQEIDLKIHTTAICVSYVLLFSLSLSVSLFHPLILSLPSLHAYAWWYKICLSSMRW